jgi:hypothetical protein
MAFLQPPSFISEGKLAAVVILALLAGIVIGIFIGFLIWRVEIIHLPMILRGEAVCIQSALVRL